MKFIFRNFNLPTKDTKMTKSHNIKITRNLRVLCGLTCLYSSFLYRDDLESSSLSAFSGFASFDNFFFLISSA